MPDPITRPGAKDAQPRAQMPTGMIIHSKSAQGSGYAKGAVVLCDGVLWVSLIASNDQWPGGDPYWTLYG